MAHGYLGDGYGIHGENDERGDDREHGWRNRDWRGRGDDWPDRNRDRDMMFGGRERGWRDDDRWSDRGSRGEDRWSDRGDIGRDRGNFRASSESRRSFSAHPDDHYRSWRDRHMSELDRDYADYCREREQAFHQDFDAWRRQRSQTTGNPQPLRTGMTQSGISHDPSGELQLDTEAETDPAGSDPTATATLGTNSSSTGRGRR